MRNYEQRFKKVLGENGPGYVPTYPNTAGAGGALGNAPNMYQPGSASGTPGTDTYATGDYRLPKMLGAVQRRNKPRKKKK
jgi:hypothetical protein